MSHLSINGTPDSMPLFGHMTMDGLHLMFGCCSNKHLKYISDKYRISSHRDRTPPVSAWGDETLMQTFFFFFLISVKENLRKATHLKDEMNPG